MFVQPVLVYQADAPALRRAYARALDRDVTPADLHGRALRDGPRRGEPSRRRRRRRGRLDLVGIAFRAERKTVDKVVDGLRFHP